MWATFEINSTELHDNMNLFERHFNKTDSPIIPSSCSICSVIQVKIQFRFLV